MHEWLAVVIAGGSGGAMSTFLPAGTDVSWPAALQDVIEANRFVSFFCHLLRNTTLGAVASFLVWALAAPGNDFSSMTVEVGTVAAAIIVGGGGVSAVNRLFQQSISIAATESALDLMSRRLRKDIEDANVPNDR